MKAEKLMIGNWVNTIHGSVQITGFKDGIIYHTSNEIGSTHGGILNYIPLTENNLINLGAKWYNKSTTHTGYGLFYIKLGTLSHYPNNDFRVFLNGHVIADNIEYIHQLQNIFTSIGEDITIKEKL